MTIFLNKIMVITLSNTTKVMVLVFIIPLIIGLLIFPKISTSIERKSNSGKDVTSNDIEKASIIGYTTTMAFFAIVFLAVGIVFLYLYISNLEILDLIIVIADAILLLMLGYRFAKWYKKKVSKKESTLNNKQ